ncbi:Disc-associated_protein [Hexamita inflata]|uniref:Disc-associated protein n=1 Tax=Hexamita inflata TaxID=28002 RepID=A0AA86TQ43_9EUKA|nr:Disc-associated protein [Hexamita inflata]
MSSSDEYDQPRGRSNFINPFSDPFGGSGFGGFFDVGKMMRRQEQMFSNAFSKMDEFMGQDASSFPKGSTQYYCSSTSTTILPNGVVETKKQTRTNDREEKEYFKQVGERKMVSKVHKDLVSGKEDIRRDLYNIKEDEIDQFDDEFRQKQSAFHSQFQDRSLGQRGRSTNSDKPLMHVKDKATKK